MSREEVKKRFNNEIASVYSQRDPAWLTEFRYAFGLVPQLVEQFIRQFPRVLDLGADTGNLSRRILEKKIPRCPSENILIFWFGQVLTRLM